MDGDRASVPARWDARRRASGRVEISHFQRLTTLLDSYGAWIVAAAFTVRDGALLRPQRVHPDRAALPSLLHGIGLCERCGRTHLCLRSLAPTTVGRTRRRRTPAGRLAREPAGGRDGPKHRGPEQPGCPWPVFSPRFWPPEVPTPQGEFSVSVSLGFPPLDAQLPSCGTTRPR